MFFNFGMHYVTTLALMFGFFLLPTSVHAAETMPGHVIILDGMSNAGKTSLSKPLLNLLGPAYVSVALDEYVTSLWLEKKGCYLPEQEFVDKVHLRVDAMFDDIRSLVLQGKNVLLDTVISGLAGENDSERCFEKLKGISIFKVLVYCSFSVAMERMKSRNEEAIVQKNPGNSRPIIISIKFGDIYRVAQEDDILIGSISKKDIEYAYEISPELSDQEKSLYMRLKNDLVSKFDLRDKYDVAITPCL